MTEEEVVSSPVMPKLFSEFRESHLHSRLKHQLACPGDQIEAAVDGYVIDIVRGSHLLEIQTGHFSAIKAKLAKLLTTRQVRVIWPLAESKWVTRLSQDGTPIGRRKSPKKGDLLDMFNELVCLPTQVLSHPHFSFEVILIHEEEVRKANPNLSWRRKGFGRCERRLLQVIGSTVFLEPKDYLVFLPDKLPTPFSASQLAEALNRKRDRTIYRMVRCLRDLGVIESIGKRGRSQYWQMQPSIVSSS